VETSSTQACETHAWRSFTEDEMKDLRSKSRAGRPPMAWVEEAEQCERRARRRRWHGNGPNLRDQSLAACRLLPLR
jgi:hypothetical protein